MIARETTAPPEPVPPELEGTVIAVEAVIVPVKPWILAVIWMLPEPVAVTSPVELTVATSTEAVDQVT
jgi:hypothetical protein